LNPDSHYQYYDFIQENFEDITLLTTQITRISKSMYRDKFHSISLEVGVSDTEYFAYIYSYLQKVTELALVVICI